MQSLHRAIGTYTKHVDAYIALTSFAKEVFIRSGIPRERVHVKPNFLREAPFIHQPRKNQIVFAGLLDEAKGAELLLEAWQQARTDATTLVMVGDGPLALHLKERFADVPGVIWRGWIPSEDVLQVFSESKLVVLPSRAYEGFPMVIVEAFSVGTPVIAPDHGGFSEIVSASGGGWLFQPGDATQLRQALEASLAISTTESDAVSYRAREAFSRYYTAEANYVRLAEIYNSAQRVSKDIG